MRDGFWQVRFREPRRKDIAGLIAVAVMMVLLLGLGIVPAVMPARMD